MTELREQVAAILRPWASERLTDADILDQADRILALEPIRERFFCDCGSPRTEGSCTGYCDRRRMTLTAPHQSETGGCK